MLWHLHQIKPLRNSYGLEKVKTNGPNQNQYVPDLTLLGRSEQALKAPHHFEQERY
jgi:hypothetical protein